MRTCVKTPLVILSALALLAGCKSSPAKASFLLVESDAVHFIQWTQEGRQIKGTIEMVGISLDNEIETTSTMFDGVLDGENVRIILKNDFLANTVRGKLNGDILENVRIILKNDFLANTVRGKLNGDILTLFSAWPADLRRATPAEYAEATKNFKMRAALNKGAK